MKEPGYNGADRIVTHGEGQLWQGDRIDGEIALLGYIENRATLARTPIDVVVLTAAELPPDNATKQLTKVQGFWVPLEDSLWPQDVIAKVLPKLEELTGKVAKSVEAGKVVLTTCHLGYNRSALTNCLVLVKLGYSPTTAIKLVREGRGPSALNNPCFRKIIEGLR